MYEFNDLESEVIIRRRLENKMSGRFILYRSGESDLESSLLIKIRDNDNIIGQLSVRTQKHYQIDASLDVKYRGNDDLESVIEAVSSSFLDASIEVRPHNRLFGKFELHEAPRVEVRLPPLADASTRSRDDLQTINYGDTKSMLTGVGTDENFESFVSFGELKDRIPDLKILESVKLRLYYINLPLHANIELHQPHTLWREMGITHANKPYSLELLSDQYTLNTRERYIEFDVLDIAQRWESYDLINYGFIIKTSNNETISFFTKESGIPPLLIVKYITSQIYSINRSELESTLFIYGRGYKEFTGYLQVHSDVGIESLDSFLYVHRIEVPVFYEVPSLITVNRPDMRSELVVSRREESNLESTITVANKLAKELEFNIVTSIPDLHGYINLDPNATLKSTLTVAIVKNEDCDSTIIISQQDMVGSLTVSQYKKTQEDLLGLLVVQSTKDEDLDSVILISQRDLGGELVVRALGEEDLDSEITIPFYEDKEANMTASVPDLYSEIVIKYKHEIDATLWIKEKEFLDSVIDVRQINDLEATITTKEIHETEALITVNVPDLGGFLHPRVPGETDLDSLLSVRKRDVSDLDSFILVKGLSNGAYYFII